MPAAPATMPTSDAREDRAKGAALDAPVLHQCRRREGDRLDVEAVHDEGDEGERENGELHTTKSGCIQYRAHVRCIGMHLPAASGHLISGRIVRLEQEPSAATAPNPSECAL